MLKVGCEARHDISIVPSSYDRRVEVSCPLVASILLANSTLPCPVLFTPERCFPFMASLNPCAGPGKRAEFTDWESETQTQGVTGDQSTRDQAKIQFRVFHSFFPPQLPFQRGPPLKANTEQYTTLGLCLQRRL